MAESKSVLLLDNYEVCLSHKLGHGGFGTVYKGKNVINGTDIAVKQCLIPSDQHGFQAMKEVKNFQQFEKHPNIVNLLDFFYRNSAFWFVMEFCNAGDLTHYMRNTTPDLDEKLKIMYDCANAVKYMHTRKNPVVHRDLKPGNILLKRECQKAVVKVTDFGLSRIMEHDPVKNYKLTTHAGTPVFMAPEIFMREKYTESVDVFSLGLVFICMLKFRPGDKELIPKFRNQGLVEELLPIGAQLGHQIRAGKTTPNLVTEDPNDHPMVISLKHLITKMTAALSHQRPTMTEVLHELGQIAGYESSLRPDSPTIADIPVQSQELKVIEKRTKLTSDVPVEQACTKATSGGDDELDILKEALDKVISEQMSSHKREVSPEVQKDKKNPYSDFLQDVLHDDKPIATPAKQIKSGDRVCVDPDEERVKVLQIGHGEYNSHMRMYLGREGLVRDRFGHVCKVQFDDGQVWTYNPEALLPLGVVQPVRPDNFLNNNSSKAKKSFVEGHFSRYDVVIMPENEELVKCLQKGHGGWNERMRNCLGVKGIVNRIQSGGHVFVEFINGDDWTINPEILQHVNTTDGQIEEGDFVMVNSDQGSVMRAQKEIGNWTTEMTELLGKTGVVQEIADGKATVEIHKIFQWSVGSLILVAKREEMHSAIRKSQASVYCNA